MAIGTSYATPVTVNGFLCRNCTDVDYAKKHIDPAHPKSGPYGINAKEDPTVTKTTLATTFGGSLASKDAKQPTTAAAASPSPSIGTQLDLSA